MTTSRELKYYLYNTTLLVLSIVTPSPDGAVSDLPPNRRLPDSAFEQACCRVTDVKPTTKRRGPPPKRGRGFIAHQLS